MRTPFGPRHPRTLALYVRGELPSAETRRVEAHVAGCAACSRAVSEERALRAALHDLPARRAPRSFALTAEQAHRTPATDRAPAWVRWAQGGGAGALAAAAVLVAAVLLTGGLPGGGAAKRAAPAAGLARQADRSAAVETSPAGASAQKRAPEATGTPEAHFVMPESASPAAVATPGDLSAQTPSALYVAETAGRGGPGWRAVALAAAAALAVVGGGGVVASSRWRKRRRNRT